MLWFRYLAPTNGATLNHRLEREIFMAWMYILECSDGMYYVGSTKNLELRLSQHQGSTGSRYISGRLPVQLVYCEEYDRASDAFYREKQVQGWTRRKREALINGNPELLPMLAKKVFDKSKIKNNSIIVCENGG
jgi:putative endonuclease